MTGISLNHLHHHTRTMLLHKNVWFVVPKSEKPVLFHLSENSHLFSIQVESAQTSSCTVSFGGKLSLVFHTIGKCSRLLVSAGLYNLLGHPSWEHMQSLLKVILFRLSPQNTFWVFPNTMVPLSLHGMCLISQHFCFQTFLYAGRISSVNNLCIS